MGDVQTDAHAAHGLVQIGDQAGLGGPLHHSGHIGGGENRQHPGADGGGGILLSDSLLQAAGGSNGDHKQVPPQSDGYTRQIQSTPNLRKCKKNRRGILRAGFRLSNMPRRVRRPQTANQVKSFSAGACTWQKILLAERVSNGPRLADHRGAERSGCPFSKKCLHFFEHEKPTRNPPRRFL